MAGAPQADDITCLAPGQRLTGKEAYRAFIAGFVPTLTGLSDIASFADGDRVALFYYPHTAGTTTAPRAASASAGSESSGSGCLLRYWPQIALSPSVAMHGVAPYMRTAVESRENLGR